MAGLVVGLAIGVAYAASLRYGLARVLAAPAERGVLLIQFGSLMRLLFGVAAFALARRLVPGMNLTWGVLAAAVVMIATLVRMARREARS
jgi:hypothetical protein